LTTTWSRVRPLTPVLHTHRPWIAQHQQQHQGPRQGYSTPTRGIRQRREGLNDSQPTTWRRVRRTTRRIRQPARRKQRGGNDGTRTRRRDETRTRRRDETRTRRRDETRTRRRDEARTRRRGGTKRKSDERKRSRR
jgi:hypothetical protein